MIYLKLKIDIFLEEWKRDGRFRYSLPKIIRNSRFPKWNPGQDLRTIEGVYKGALYENVVGEAFSKSGYGLSYYKREDSTLEEDFLFERHRI